VSGGSVSFFGRSGATHWAFYCFIFFTHQFFLSFDSPIRCRRALVDSMRIRLLWRFIFSSLETPIDAFRFLVCCLLISPSSLYIHIPWSLAIQFCPHSPTEHESGGLNVFLLPPEGSSRLCNLCLRCMIFFPSPFFSWDGWNPIEFPTKNKNKVGEIGSRLLVKDGRRKGKNVTIYFAICSFLLFHFSFLVMGEIGRVVFFSYFPHSNLRSGVCCVLYGKVCIRGVIVCGVEDAWIWKSGHVFLSFRSLS